MVFKGGARDTELGWPVATSGDLRPKGETTDTWGQTGTPSSPNWEAKQWGGFQRVLSEEWLHTAAVRGPGVLL